jgi:DNA-binding PadR family transcriptional regulator
MKLGYILLGLIQMKPRISGYEMKSIITQSTGYFFSAHLSQIYPSLKDLTLKGWVTYEVIAQDGKPNLKAYSITDDGLAALNEWLTQPYQFENTRANFDMYFTKLILMGHLDPADIIAYIDSGIEAFGAELENHDRRSLSTERTFIAQAPDPARSRYLTIWVDEFDFIRDALVRRIEWLKALRAKLV